ncbi:hypothetical protein MN116_005580 [Schistosoma mekongi]|uniref:NADP-dependent oxidoreductase domain-containing protein n=1 Tax=Schistosoma mekongi TaxID=38744 RepID=A0AAE2D3L6_SCHME|nr:hypothetical protein MN116_005580 [Schistosoma mekongi]
MEPLKMNNGHSIPVIGLGTWNSPPGEVGAAVKKALETGYRHLDCAYVYRNEAEIGESLENTLKSLKLKREDIFITSKILQYGGDLFPTDSNGQLCLDNVPHEETWKEMEKLVDEGLVKSIGLSNFNKRQIENILKHCRIKPANLQIEIHANFPNIKLVEYAQSIGLTVTAYAPLGSPAHSP